MPLPQGARLPYNSVGQRSANCLTRDPSLDREMSLSYKPLPSLAELMAVMCCNPEKGLLIWKINRGSARIGAAVGTLNNHGYLFTSIKGERYLVHRLIWLFATEQDPGQMQIDHIDGDRLNNCISNLRICERIENNKNVKPHSDSRLGCLGVTIHKPGVYRVRIMHNGVNRHVGLFPCLDEAIAARRRAEVEFHGQFSSYVSRSVGQG